MPSVRVAGRYVPALSRRSLLTTGSGGILVFLSGCALRSGGSEGIPVHVRNETSQTHSFVVRVRFVDEVLLNGQTELEAGESSTFSLENPDETMRVTVAERVDQESESTERVDIDPGGTQYISVVLEAPDQLRILAAVE